MSVDGEGAALAGLQRQFLARLRGRPDHDFDRAIAHGRMPLATGVNIYTHAYGARLREALEHDHPVLGTYLGDALWDTLCHGYLEAHPSRHRSLRDFGNDLPTWLARADAFHAHPQIAELAQFERRLLDSFDAADATAADWDELLDLPEQAWPKLRIGFHPSLRLHHVASNSVEIWHAIKQGQAPPSVEIASNRHWALWRDAQRVSRYRSLPAEESAAVTHCLQGGDFAGLCVMLFATRPVQTVPRVALDYLGKWCGEGWVSRWN